MTSTLHTPISDEQVASFRRDGVICLRNAFDASWIERLRVAADEVLADQSKLRGGLDAAAVKLAVGQYLWHKDEVFHDYTFNSPAAAIGARLLEALRVSLLYDEFIVKEPGSETAISWHQDGPSWPLNGKQALTIWMPLDPASTETGVMRYAKGAHLGPEYSPFINVSNTASDVMHMDRARCPDYDQLGDEFEILQWSVEPGDCLVHHMDMPHATGPNTSKTIRRRAHTTRWVGEACTFKEGNFQIRGNYFEDPGLKEGDPVVCNLFPEVEFKASW